MAVAALALTGCSNGAIANAPTPTASHGLAPAAFILHAGQMPGYSEQGGLAITPAQLADQTHDPAVTAQLARDGFTSGASENFADPGTTAPTRPFASVTSQALFFADSRGAQEYFGDEINRQRQQPPPPSGTTSPLPALPAGGVDQQDGVQAYAPAATPNDVAERAFFALARRGRVLAAVFAYGDTSVATPDAFAAVFGLQQALLRQSPD
jgi:hypothetical protein